MAADIDYAERKVRADAARAELKAYRAELVLKEKTAKPVHQIQQPKPDTPRQRASDAARERFRALKCKLTPDEAKNLPYDGKPMGTRKAPVGRTEALLRSEIVMRPLRAKSEWG